MNFSLASFLMSSDRDDLRNRFGSFEDRPSAAEAFGRRDPARPPVPELRVQHLARHLRALGRLNVYVLARDWNCSPAEVIHCLTALHQAGRLKRIDEEPYFRVLGPGAERV